MLGNYGKARLKIEELFKNSFTNNKANFQKEIYKK